MSGHPLTNEEVIHQGPDGSQTSDEGASRIWLPELVERFASSLHPNDVACNLRLVNKATAAQFRGRREFTTVQLSQPVPAHAFARQWGTPSAMRSLTLNKRRELLCLTAASGSVPNLELALAHVGLTQGGEEKIVTAAATAGHVEMVGWLLARQDFKPHALIAEESAAAAGQRAVCELLLSRGETWGAHMLFIGAAARGGHTELLDWLLLRHRSGPIGPEDSLRSLGGYERGELFRAAVTGCGLQVLHRLYHRCFGGDQAFGGPPQLQPQLRQLEEELDLASPFCWYVAAAASPTPDWRAKVEWLEALLGAPPPERYQEMCCAAAAACPDAADRLTWLRQRGFAADWRSGDAAARAGNVAALEYLLAEGVGLHPGLGALAAEAGQLGVLTALHARGHPLDPHGVASSAAAYGHLPVVEWAVEALAAEVQEAEWVEYAAYLGSVELMAALRGRGFVWSRFTMLCLAKSGCEEALEWAVAQGCPVPTDGRPYECAARNCDLAVLSCLRRLGCPWGPSGDVFTRCIGHGVYLPILQWLVREGCPVNWRAAVAAAGPENSFSRPEVQAWLAEQQLLLDVAPCAAGR